MPVLQGRAAPPYSYTILPGNEPSLLLECLARRPWWQETPDKAGGPVLIPCKQQQSFQSAVLLCGAP